ncbi:serine carboxypeptidase 24-like [Syzygium oleosum]|uniref:serine carboxypeptidase 24-like n=1 Tax=Syzygium oleosum TaxID=219896 RepID=UPI0024BBDFFF|nr:serine carboxypeptidase 24-like [Syzygium oleosum]
MGRLASPDAFHLLLLSLLMSSVAARTSIDDAASAKITRLPRQPKDACVAQYSGYVRISERKKMFYWLVEASSDADSKPLLLWLNGGPGCSSIGYGAFQEIGPFQVLPNGKLAKRQISWDTEANLLFLDSPFGVGYSVRSIVEQDGDNSTAMDSYAFLNKWLEVFPKFKYREFYLAGESYAGHYIPQLAQVIVNQNKGIARPIINLKGLLLGNPSLDKATGDPAKWEFYWNLGLLSDTTYENMRKFCSVDRASEGCSKAQKEAGDNEMGVVNIFNVYTRPCGDNSIQDLMYRDGNEFCMDADTVKYLKRKEVQECFHVDTSYIPLNYTLCSEPRVKLIYSKSDKETSVLPILKELIETRLRIWIYRWDPVINLPTPTARVDVPFLPDDEYHMWTLKALHIHGTHDTYKTTLKPSTLKHEFILSLIAHGEILFPSAHTAIQHPFGESKKEMLCSSFDKAS